MMTNCYAILTTACQECSQLVVRLMRLWRKSAKAELIDAIIQEGIERRKIDAAIEDKKHALELRKLELEMEHIEQLGEERRKDRAERENARLVRQKAAAYAREVRKQNKQQGDASVCRVCLNGSDPSLTAREIEWHHNGHKEGPSIWSQ